MRASIELLTVWFISTPVVAGGLPGNSRYVCYSCDLGIESNCCCFSLCRKVTTQQVCTPKGLRCTLFWTHTAHYTLHPKVLHTALSQPQPEIHYIESSRGLRRAIWRLLSLLSFHPGCIRPSNAFSKRQTFGLGRQNLEERTIWKLFPPCLQSSWQLNLKCCLWWLSSLENILISYFYRWPFCNLVATCTMVNKAWGMSAACRTTGPTWRARWCSWTTWAPSSTPPPSHSSLRSLRP